MLLRSTSPQTPSTLLLTNETVEPLDLATVQVAVTFAMTAANDALGQLAITPEETAAALLGKLAAATILK